ncbi:MAG: 2Fe-2S iron-sulfur cluster binding domain-containing protein [Phycisphaerales bacterium]|jgi:Na+-transporting NADH:ubiquinone oxidoreductase subunit F|nr:2Fe-2S iron-sulfur cluster binding domain-containing protein [Phycisphaerales bacterium]MBT7170883.1 2Fe-2S iron-sulfur cluster binding domain-containing protein [Phycisphaerales bacterium]
MSKTHPTLTIDLNHGAKVLEVPTGQTLLAALKAQEVHLASACGGKGLCGFCKVKVLFGAPAPGPVDKQKLSEDEITNGMRLACQMELSPGADLAIEVAGTLLPARSYRAVVERIDPLTYDINHVRLRLVDPAAMTFEPGQYIQLDRPASAECPGVSRAYSMASRPSETDIVELMIRRVPNGMMSVWVHECLAIGDEVSLTGPFGEFALSSRKLPMVWVAGGSGMSPFWSMVHHLREIGNTRKVYFFFGAVALRDLFLVDEWRTLEAELDWLEFIPAISGGEENWDGERGLITEVIARHLPEIPSPLEAYLCGSPGMCNAACNVLTDNGVNERMIFFDKFA